MNGLENIVTKANNLLQMYKTASASENDLNAHIRQTWKVKASLQSQKSLDFLHIFRKVIE